MTKDTLRMVFVVGVIVFSAAFLAMTFDTLAQIPMRTNQQNLTRQAIDGKLAWQRHVCIDCHTILGNGAYYAPDLTKVTDDRSPDYLRGWLRNPGGQMPNQRLTDQEVEDLIVWLEWVSNIDTNGWPPGSAPVVTGDPAAQGAATYRSAGCTGCHGQNGQGTATAPSLKGVTQKYDADYLTRWLKNPQAVKPGSAMPSLGLSDEQVAALLAHLETLE